MDSHQDNEKGIEGTIPFTVDGETYQTWYKVFGDLGKRTHRPLVVLHGGPGLSHDYMLPISDLARLGSIPVVFYDQIGNSRSSHIPHKGDGFWTIDLFIDELVNLLVHFGISDDFDILGHSWGAMLGAEFVVRRQPAGLKRLILANTLTEMRLWKESHAQLRKNFPQDVQDALQKHEQAGTTSSPEYLEAMGKFYARHACRVQPVPEEVQYSLKQNREDPTVYKFTYVNGELTNWKITDRLHLIRVPSLLVTGEYDMAQEFVWEGFFHNIPKIKRTDFRDSSHLPHWEERERYMEEVIRFLTHSDDS